MGPAEVWGELDSVHPPPSLSSSYQPLPLIAEGNASLGQPTLIIFFKDENLDFYVKSPDF